MATIKFRAKVQTLGDADGAWTKEFVPVPTLTRAHCDMTAFRSHVKYGGYANSDLFPGMLARIRKEMLNGRVGLFLEDLPPNVEIDASGFLATVTVTV